WPPSSRRADGGPGAPPRPRGRAGAQGPQARRAVDPARGAKPPPRPLRGGSDPHPEPRPDPPLRAARRASRQRGGQVALSWGELRRLTGMRFGTYYFFQAPPGHRHDDIIRRELEQIEWTEELGFDEIWLTEHHFIDYGLS